MLIDICTLFPGMFPGVFGESILRIAQEKRLIDIVLHDMRDYTLNKHGKVDDKPYGGGPGMVLAAEPVFRAVEALRTLPKRGASELVLLTPQGERLSQTLARDLSKRPGLILVCGHYEGFDERIRTGLRPREISIGDYVLTGGEIAAMVVVDAVARLVPGVLGAEESTRDESFSGGLLEYPHYTRPAEFRGMRVPEVLLSGHHAEIAKWRSEQSRARTAIRRPDLLKPEAPEPEPKRPAPGRRPSGRTRKSDRHPRSPS